MPQLAKSAELLYVDEYLNLEAKSRIKHEYTDGKIFAMAGASRNHSLIASNINRNVGNQVVPRGCEVHQSDLRVRVRDTHYVYPDIVVVCGEAFMAESGGDTLLNPLVIFEILSKSTESRDRQSKASDYLALDSLQEYDLVTQTKMQIEHFVRQSKKQWQLTIYTEAAEEIYFPSLDCRVTVEQIYQMVKFPALTPFAAKNQENAKRSS